MNTALCTEALVQKNLKTPLSPEKQKIAIYFLPLLLVEERKNFSILLVL